MHPVQDYLKQLRDIRATGGAVAEESYYGALEALLNEVGKKLKPKVRCVLQLQNRGAGKPDGGLYTADQFQRSKDREPMQGQPPERGVIEVKPTSDDAWLTARGKQVSKYWGKYGQVLVTNYRDFVLVGRDADGDTAWVAPSAAMVYKIENCAPLSHKKCQRLEYNTHAHAGAGDGVSPHPEFSQAWAEREIKHANPHGVSPLGCTTSKAHS